MARRVPLPRTTALLHCEECGESYEGPDVNLPQFMRELGRRRREHAVRRHGWQPHQPDPASPN
jgi:hypothetical protein